MKPRILVIDGGALLTERPLVTLPIDEYEMILVRDTHEATHAAANVRPALIVLEIRIPTDAKSVLEELRDCPRTKSTPLIVITDLVSFDDAMMEITQRAPVLQRPFTEDTLMRTIRQVLGDHAQGVSHEGLWPSAKGRSE